MTFGEAHELMDLLLDKADQPYFTTEEKDKFLNIAYFDWFDKALDRYDTDPEIAKCLGKLVQTFSGKMEYASSIVMHTSRQGAQSVPFRLPSGPTDLADHGVPINSLRSISRYPVARLLHLQVKYINTETGESTHYKEANMVKSNEHGCYDNDTNSDPFNKADDKNIKCYMEGSYLRVFPTELDNGFRLNGWRDFGTDGFSVAGIWKARCITYPMASNVAAGNHDIVNSIVNAPGDARSWGTVNLQMGALTYSQQVDSSGDLQYNNNPVAASTWGWPIHICNEIVQSAVRLMTVNIESDNYQNQFIETQQSKSI